ncbi:MAG: dihydropteroate synthase [Deltaproteobacteria bacterium]|nr:dihydropteroate synthase [Deltaproteobacteria bacterium]
MDPQQYSGPPPLVCRKKIFNLRARSYVVGVLNVTPDSFSDGGRFCHVETAVAHGLQMAEAGADVIDVGGESTRPGAKSVNMQTELDRVVPVVRELASRTGVPLSVDTTKAEVARQALEAGADIINDVSALRFDPDMAALAADQQVPVVLMHMRGTPATMQRDTGYANLVDEIYAFLQERIEAAVGGGIARERIVVDPGIGFGKSVQNDNFTILHHLDSFVQLGCALMIGPSRKAFIGSVVKREAGGRDEGTAAAVAVGVYNGAHFVRVHNVGMMQMVCRIVDAIKQADVDGASEDRG